MGLQDKIGREDFVNKICGLVDSLGKDKNFSMAINGAWGSGKTFVLDMIEEKLSERQEYIVIKYDAWENNFYPDPLIAILSCVIDGIDEKLYLLDRKKERAMKAAKSGVNTLAKVSAKIEKLQTVIEGIKNIIKIFHNPIDTAVLGDFKSYKTLLKETKDILNEITQVGEYREKQTKLIILVDEIDRCLPDEQLKVLERLHHLFDIKNCVVIVTMNQASVVKTVHTIYGIDGYEYLRKFFDFTLKLDVRASEYLKNLLDECIKKFIKDQNFEEIKCAVDMAYQCLLCGNKNVLDKVDNRELTRYYDAVVNASYAFGFQKLTEHYIFFIMIALYIRRIISPTFLSEEEIIAKQDERNMELELYKYPEKEMLYYDFLLHYLGIDRENTPIQMQQLHSLGGYKVVEYSYIFNEIIYRSSINNFQNHSSFLYRVKTDVSSDVCKELCRLVILYGGEQEKCER